MGEILGVILCIIGSFCVIKVMTTSNKHRSNNYDRKSIYEQEYNHHRNLSQTSDVGFYVFVGLICSFLGIYLIGMFDK